MPAQIVNDVDEVLSCVAQFESLDRGKLADFSASARSISLNPGETIISEGDVGTECFVIGSGEMHVIGRRFDGTELILSRIGRGVLFGEQALLGSGQVRRTASVRAISKTRLYAFDKSAFAALLSDDQAQIDHLRRIGAKQAELRNALSKNSILQDMGAERNLSFESFKTGDVVVRQGDVGERVYLILAGSARVVKTEHDVDRVLSNLLPGQYFGELAVLTGAPRAASVHATSDMEVASIDATWFREAVATNPRLNSIMGALQAMYLLPQRGLVTLQGGQLGSEPTLTAVHHLPDKRRVISTRLVEMNAFQAHQIDAPDATASARYRSDDGTVLRTIHVADGRLIEIESEGRWDGLGEALGSLIDATPVGPDDLASFRSTGDFGSIQIPERDSAEIICRCTGVTAGTLSQAIADGCCTLDAVARRTTATMICGGCSPVVKEFLGEGVWQPAVCEDALPLTDDIRAFRLRWLRSDITVGLPGQYVVLQARIGGRWVERPYSLSNVGADGCCEITVKREPKGIVSPWLFETLKHGVALRMSPPQGEFHMGAAEGRDIVFLAGGVGITPALALIRELRSQTDPVRLHLDYSESSKERMICRDEIEALCRDGGWLTATFRPTRVEGRLGQQGIQELTDRFPDAVFMLCGSEPFVDSLQALLVANDVRPDRVLSERFSPVG